MITIDENTLFWFPVVILNKLNLKLSQSQSITKDFQNEHHQQNHTLSDLNSPKA